MNKALHSAGLYSFLIFTGRQPRFLLEYLLEVGTAETAVVGHDLRPTPVLSANST